MQYYNSKGEIVELSGLKSGIYGFNGEIMRLSDKEIYKRYFFDTEEINRISVAVFEFIKQVANRHLAKLDERFYQVTPYLNATDVVNNPELCTIDAYTYEWVTKENIDILAMPVDFLTDNLKELLDLADYLSDYGLYLHDVKSKNSVINSSGIVLIDPDIYTFSYKASYKEFPKLEDTHGVRKWNRRMIIELFKDICCESLQLRDNAPEVTVNNLFENASLDGKYDASIVSKKLKGFKTPLDYVVSTYR